MMKANAAEVRVMRAELRPGALLQLTAMLHRSKTHAMRLKTSASCKQIDTGFNGDPTKEPFSCWPPPKSYVLPVVPSQIRDRGRGQNQRARIFWVRSPFDCPRLICMRDCEAAASGGLRGGRVVGLRTKRMPYTAACMTAFTASERAAPSGGWHQRTYRRDVLSHAVLYYPSALQYSIPVPTVP